MNDKIYRIQDSDGRGPYKPGWSHQWQNMRCLVDGRKHPTYMDEFPGILARINLRHDTMKGHFGCGFRTMEQLKSWFNDDELEKLNRFGYSIVAIEPDEILAESDKQLVFWNKKPLKKVAKAMTNSARG